MVQSVNTTLVVDADPDFRYQMLRAGVKTPGRDHLTSHKDHVAGLADDVRAFNFFSGKECCTQAGNDTGSADT